MKISFRRVGAGVLLAGFVSTLAVLAPATAVADSVRITSVSDSVRITSVSDSVRITGVCEGPDREHILCQNT
ncbi:hypothetical protein KIPE111705_42355 [Kibdelosporangium persicum]|uniref:hypothetical protein n=1 Tax=Kibdelosporangium persicum TaxID=2698649 RepID=UPI001566C9A9|nr:hypothetical protein [Kibdelosporangium persicum]